jgi:hypothetical protein
MARPKKEVEPGEQLELIDVSSELQKTLKPVLRKYKAAQTERIAFLAEEKKLKNQILKMVHDAGLRPLEDGKIRFHCNGILVVVTPRDEKITIKEDDDDVEGSEE